VPWAERASPPERFSAAPPGRIVRARRIRFDYPTGSLGHHYVDGDLVMSHAVAYLSAAPTTPWRHIAGYQYGEIGYVWLPVNFCIFAITLGDNIIRDAGVCR
jgi:hypothetical protein